MEEVFLPVRTILHLRDVPFDVILDCCENNNRNSNNRNWLVAMMTDALRLKQIMLNLARITIRRTTFMNSNQKYISAEGYMTEQIYICNNVEYILLKYYQ